VSHDVVPVHGIGLELEIFLNMSLLGHLVSELQKF
jgi:hypothetical protein